MGPLAFAVTTLTSLLLLNFIAKRFEDLVGKGLPWDVIAEFFLLSIPFVVAMTLPMAVLIATLYAFSRLAADSEITAMMANGVGTRQLMTPVVGAGLVLSILMIGFNDQVLPRANYRLSGLQTSIAQKKPTLTLRAQTMNEVVRNRLYLQMARLDNATNAMYDVTIHDLSDNTQIRRTIVADSGLLAFAPNGRDLQLTLYHGYVQETRHIEPTRFQRIHFVSNVMRVPDVENQLARSSEPGYKGDREMSICEMHRTVMAELGRRDSLRTELERVNPEAAAEYTRREWGGRVGGWYCGIRLVREAEAAGRTTAGGATAGGMVGQVVDSTAPIVERIGGAFQGMQASPEVRTEALKARLKQAEQSISSFEVEIHKKFAISLACLVFALLGPPIALRFPRGGVGLTIGVSLAVFAVYYVGLIAGEELANNLKVSPFVAMWAANGLLGTIALLLVARMGRTGPSSRGTSFGEMMARLLPWRRRRWRA